MCVMHLCLSFINVKFKKKKTSTTFTCSGSVWSSAHRTDTEPCHSPRWPGISGSRR